MFSNFNFKEPLIQINNIQLFFFKLFLIPKESFPFHSLSLFKKEIFLCNKIFCVIHFWINLQLFAMSVIFQSNSMIDLKCKKFNFV